jgi:hypothetical protein
MGIGHWNATGHKLAAELIYNWLPSVAPQLAGEKTASSQKPVGSN